MTFPTWVSVTEDSETGFTNTHTYSLPATVAANDRLWLSAAGGHDSFGPTGGTLTGWTLAYDLTLNAFYRWQVYTKVADGTEGGTTVQFSTTNAVRSSCQVIRISGADVGGPGTGYTVSTGSAVSFGTNPNSDSVTAAWGSADNLFVSLMTCGSNGTTVTTNPISYTAGADGDAAAQYVVASAFRQLAAATDDPGAYTIAVAENWAALTVVLRPTTGVNVTPARAVAKARATTAPFASVPVAVTPARAEARAAALGPIGYPATAATAPFPEARLGVRVEVAWGADLNVPSSWVWTDLTDRLVGTTSELTIGLTAGRAPESADTQPSAITLNLDNSDGALTPGNPASPWWPNVERGAPLRIWVEGTSPALYVPGTTGSYAYTPDHPDFDVTDLDVRVLIEPDQWAAAARYTATQLQSFVDVQRLVTKDGGTGNLGWMLSTCDVGRPALQWSTTGTDQVSKEAASTSASLRPLWLAATIDANNGAGAYTATVWRWDAPGTPPADVTTWEVVDSWTGTGTTTVVNGGTTPVMLGYRNPAATPSFRGRILKAELRSGINGTVTANPDFTAAAVGAPVILDTTGKPWLIEGDAEITRYQIRFTGQIAELAIEWPHGDHAAGIGIDDPAGRAPTESRAVVTAAGPLRRLGQGQPALRSTLYRGVTSATAIDNIDAYWPMEDGAAAAHFASGLPSGPPMAFTGFRAAADSTLASSSALPTTTKPGDPVTWSATVTGGTSTRWAVEWVTKWDDVETSPAATELMRVAAAGGISLVRAEVSSGGLLIQAYSGATLLGTLTFFSVASKADTWLLLRIELEQAGANVNWRWSFVDLATGGGTTLSGTLTSVTMGAVSGLSATTTGPPGQGLTMGHVIVHDGTLATGWLFGADTAWVGESAAHRFWRLCAEEQIPVEIIGDPKAWAGSRGDLTRSQAMGPQRQLPLTDLLAECVACDMGAMMERRRTPGLAYRTRQSIEDQEPQLALNAADNEIAGQLTPVLDDAALRNDITVATIGGSSARAVDQVSIDKHGRYDDAVRIAGVGGLAIQATIVAAQAGLADAIDNQNQEQADWRLALANATAVRYPTITIDLGMAPRLIDAWLATAIGDRLTVFGLPVQHPSDQVELLVDHISERITPTGWRLQLGCSPGDGWLTGELEP